MSVDTSKFEQDTPGKAVIFEVFPNSGKKIIQEIGQTLVGWDNNAHVNNAFEPKPLPSNNEMPFSGGLIFMNSDADVSGQSLGKLLVGTHCQEYFFRQIWENWGPDSIFNECIIPDGDQSTPVQSDLPKDIIAGALQLVRNPLDVVISRLKTAKEENKLEGLNITLANIEDHSDFVLRDVKTYMRWLQRARARRSGQLTEVMWYEDLLHDPNKFASDLSRVLGVGAADRKDLGVNWEAKLRRNHPLAYHETEQLPVYLDVFTPNMIRKMLYVMDDEMREWDC
jgi:hypothetical protein